MRKAPRRLPRRTPQSQRSWRTVAAGLGVMAFLAAVSASPSFSQPPSVEQLPEPGFAVARAQVPTQAQDQDAKVKAKKAKKAKPAPVESPAATAPAAVVPAPKSSEPIKLAPRLSVAQLSAKIDQHVAKRLAEDKIPASPVASDAEFLRRVYLDIVGVIPTVDEARAFLDDQDPAKRIKLIDKLLASEKFGEHFADIWQSMMLPRDSANRRLAADPIVSWLKKNFNENKTWDKLVAELLTSEGSQDKNGAVTFFLANQTPDKFTDQTTRLFLGVQLQCAQCHNHPFTSWKQAEYWGMAQFFMKVRPDNVNKAAKAGNSPGISETGKGKAKLPEGAMTVPAKFLQGEQPKLDTGAPYRPVLAQWMTSANNPFFAKAMVNRMWQHFMGRGIVNPVDDMHENNAPTHPALLAELSEQFKSSGFDLKDLIRTICNSQTYQRSSKAASEVDTAGVLFAHMAIKPFTPEQLYDSLTQVVGPAPRGQQAVNKKMQVRGQGNSPRLQFVNFFMADEGADPTEYQAGIPQALRLMNSPQFNRPSGLLEQATKAAKSPAEVIEYLHLGTLSRRPTADETKRLVEYVSKNDTKQAYGDILWALLNSSEFTLNH